MGSMLRKKEIEFPKISEESPVMILIISQGGEPLFFQSFTEKQTFEEDLIGNFLIAFNSFSGELFAEGLDRANFGQYTILMRSISPFLICYLFKGQSYLAQHRIKRFVDNIQKNKTIWETFKRYDETNQVLELKDIPALDPLITELFINKNITVFS
jgi:hypothetical protein